MPGSTKAAAERLAEELEPRVSLRVACAAWQPGDADADVIERARAASVVA